MKNIITQFKFLTLTGLLIFTQFSFGQTNYVVGESVADSLAEFNLISYGYCYEQGYSRIHISFPDSEVTGVSHVLIITSIETEDGVTSTAYTDNYGVFKEGDTIPFDGSVHYFYCPEASIINGVFKAVGVPEVEGETYECGEVTNASTLGECFAHHLIYYFNEDTVSECEVQPCSNTESSLVETVCESYTLNGETYTETGTYTQVLENHLGCDSTLTLDLTILSSTSATISETACQSYTLNGETYTETGTYTQVVENHLGCDSTITLDLMILTPSTASISEKACQSYTINGETFTETGTHTQVVENHLGCDSTITLDLIIHHIDDIETDVILMENTLIAPDNVLIDDELEITYQWLDCNEAMTPIQGETNQNFETQESGDFAVRVSNGICTNQSDCIAVSALNLSKTNLFTDFRIYPNPNNGTFNVESNTQQPIDLIITDALGKQVHTQTIANSQKTISLNLPTGIYMVSFVGEDVVMRRKMVVK